MAVAVNPIQVSRSGRRLLSEETQHEYIPEFSEFSEKSFKDVMASPGWELAASPCKELAMAWRGGKTLGILERYNLELCGYWRFVGKEIIEMAQLTPLKDHECFLVSVDDFARAVASRDVLVELIRKPWLFAHALLYHPWLRPLRAAASVVANLLEQNAVAAEYLRNMTLKAMAEAMNETEDAEDETKIGRRLLWEDEGSRQLLSVLSDIEMVQAFTGSVIRTSNSNSPLNQRVASAWGEGPYSWPPKFDYTVSNCPAGLAIYGSGKDTLMTLAYYYANWDKPMPKVDKSLRATLPHVSFERIQNLTVKSKTWAGAAYHYVLGLAGMDPSGLILFIKGSQPWSLRWILVSVTKCDLGSVLSCNKKKRDLLMSCVVILIFYFVVKVISTALGFPIISTLMFWAIPSIILWYVYGMAPTCLPMIPTCLMGDIIDFISSVVPPHLSLPDGLRCDNNTCLRSCSELNFTTWFDPVFFAICDVDPETCRILSQYTPPTILNQIIPPFQERLGMHYVSLSGELRDSKRVCTWVTWILAVPVLSLLLGVFFLISAIIIGLVSLIPSLFALAAQTLAFHRVQE